MCSLDMFNGQANNQHLASQADQLFESLQSLDTLRCLDLSKNKLPHNVSIKMMATLPKLRRLQVLSLCNVNLNDENNFQFC